MQRQYQWQSGLLRGLGVTGHPTYWGALNLGTAVKILSNERRNLAMLGPLAPQCAVDGINDAMVHANAALDKWLLTVEGAGITGEDKDKFIEAVRSGVRKAKSELVPLTEKWTDGPSQWRYPESFDVEIPGGSSSMGRAVFGRSSFGFMEGMSAESFIIKALPVGATPAAVSAATAPVAAAAGVAAPNVWVLAFIIDLAIDHDSFATSLRQAVEQYQTTEPGISMHKETDKAVARIKGTYKQLSLLRTNEVSAGINGIIEAQRAGKSADEIAALKEAFTAKYQLLMGSTDPATVSGMPLRWDGSWPASQGGTEKGSSLPTWVLPVGILLGIGLVGILMASEDR